MQGIKRRVIYVGLYELLVILLSTLLLKWLTQASSGESLTLSILLSVIAILWNLVFNYGFEFWETKTRRQGRNLRTRSLHTLGFEIGLLILSVPLLMWWLDLGLIQAVVMDFTLLVFFLVYTFVFTWVFDAVFGLPQSAQGACA
ncbi:MAG TPA: PACE efflux transporter [Cellvibrio sp.]|nr:PACE efflux transporter [Cellvibrio sp.]